MSVVGSGKCICINWPNDDCCLSKPCPVLQDHASNSSHSSLRGSSQASAREEHPVNPVVSVSVSVEIAPPHTLCLISMLLFQCTDISDRNSQVYSSVAVELRLRFSVLITVFIFVSFNSSFQPHLGSLQAGRRRGTIKEDATLSTTTVELQHGHDPSFRYTAGFLLYTDTLTLIFSF